ncbi:MAG: hypothetical protein KGY53_12980 [Wenzhouxiangellaceae bacterium]|jgi:hypothetical protein|nr:hypothetical protein [Wenzhouxiangellaceae bacterium]
MLVRHFARLPTGLIILWCFLIWYLVMAALHFEPSLPLWLNALAMSALIGTALVLSARKGRARGQGFWQIFRFYAIPFCVASFSALVHDEGFYAMFAPEWSSNLLALGGCLAFLAWIVLARRLSGDKSSAPSK